MVAGVLSSWSLWLTGWPDQARSQMRRSLNCAKELEHIFSYIFVTFNAAQIPLWCGDFDDAERLAIESINLGREYDIAQYIVYGGILQTCIQVQRGKLETEHSLLIEGLSQYRALQAQPALPLHLGLVADAYGQLGCIDEGVIVIAEALCLAETQARDLVGRGVAETERRAGAAKISSVRFHITNLEKAKSKRQRAKSKNTPPPIPSLQYPSRGGSRSVFSAMPSRLLATSKVTRAARNDESCPFVAAARKTPRSAQDAVCNL